MNIVCTSIYWDNFKRLADTTVHQILRRYCEKHGYTFLPMLVEGYVNPDRLEMMKVITRTKHPLYLGIFENLKPDYLFHLDTDSVITNSDIKLESIIERYPYDFIATSDKAGLCVGNFIAKNTDQVKKMFVDCQEVVGAGKYEHGQTYLRENKPDFMCATPQRVMNAYDCESRLEPMDDPGNWQPGDFLVHLTGLTYEKQFEVLDKKWMRRVI